MGAWNYSGLQLIAFTQYLLYKSRKNIQMPFPGHAAWGRDLLFLPIAAMCMGLLFDGSQVPSVMQENSLRPESKILLAFPLHSFDTANSPVIFRLLLSLQIMVSAFLHASLVRSSLCRREDGYAKIMVTHGPMGRIQLSKFCRGGFINVLSCYCCLFIFRFNGSKGDIVLISAYARSSQMGWCFFDELKCKWTGDDLHLTYGYSYTSQSFSSLGNDKLIFS